LILNNFTVQFSPRRQIKTTPEELAAAVFPVIAVINDYFGTSFGWRRAGANAKLYGIVTEADCLRFVKPCRNDIPGNIVPEWGYRMNLYFCPISPKRHVAVINILWGDYNDYLPQNRINIGLRGQTDRKLIEKIQLLLRENFYPTPVLDEISNDYLYFGKDPQSEIDLQILLERSV
jgi:hypothetical protein